MKKILLAIASLSFLLGTAFIPSDLGNRDSVLMNYVIKGLEARHYEKVIIDDAFSADVHKAYLKSVDPGKRFFLESDLEHLAMHKLNIDNEILEGQFEFFEATNRIYQERLKDVEAIYQKALAKSMDFGIDENLVNKRSGQPQDVSEFEDVWRKEVKYRVLAKYVELKTKKEEDSESKYASMSEEELELTAREKILDTYIKWSKRVNEVNHQERISQYLNTITRLYDPHTNYMAPKAKKNFDQQMSGQLEGIGAVLSQQEGYLKIVEIITGSPSHKQGELKKDFVIMKVAQGADEPVDIYDMRMDEAINLIKGKKGTEVRLTVKNVAGDMIVIPIIRDIVEIRSTFAKSVVIEKDKKIGYIYLPQFYANFNASKNGRSCAKDIEKELVKLQKENIDGIVFDLRNNSGGSLHDVISIAGLFIESGPVVQVKSRYGDPQVWKDRDPELRYDGPLVVMVNSNSASASEIMAAAMQDYKRAVIVGSKSTYGKGTVQRLMNMPQDFGSMKLTVQKFYRINGGATQLKGVEPDIVLPDQYAYIKTGERQNKTALDWDEIPAAKYQEWNGVSSKINRLRKASDLRVASEHSFTLLDEQAKWIKDSKNRNELSLSLDKFIAQKKGREQDAKKFKDIFPEIENLDVKSLMADIPRLNLDPNEAEDHDKWHKVLRKDIQLNEAVEILEDLIG